MTLPEAMSKSFEMWQECASVTCAKCKQQYNGRFFAAIRLKVPLTNPLEATLGPEVFIVQLGDLDKLVCEKTGGAGLRLSQQDIIPFMQANWHVRENEYQLGYAGVRGTRSAKMPEHDQQFTVTLTAISKCQCKLMSNAQSGKLLGPSGNSCVPLTVVDSSSSENNGPGNGAPQYFDRMRKKIEKSYGTDGLQHESRNAQTKGEKIPERFALASLALNELRNKKLSKPVGLGQEAADVENQPPVSKTLRVPTYEVSPLKPSEPERKGKEFEVKSHSCADRRVSLTSNIVTDEEEYLLGDEDADEELMFEDTASKNSTEGAMLTSVEPNTSRSVGLEVQNASNMATSFDGVMTDYVPQEMVPLTQQQTNKAWNVISQGSEYQQLMNEINKLKETRISLSKLDRKEAVCGVMGSDAVQGLEDLFNMIQRKDSHNSICLFAKDVSKKLTDYVKTVSNQMLVLKSEFTLACRTRDLYDLRRLGTQKVLVLIRGLLNHTKNKHLLDIDLDVQDHASNWLDNFAAEFADLLDEADRWWDADAEGRKEFDTATRAGLLKDAGFPMALLIYAKEYRGPWGHQIPNVESIMDSRPTEEDKLPFYFHYVDKDNDLVYVAGSKLAWCTKGQYEDLRMRFTNMIVDQDGRDANIKKFTEYCKTFLDIWMPDEVEQWNAFVGFPNPYFRVILEIFKNSLVFFGTLANHIRVRDNKPTIVFTAPFRAATAKLARLLSDRRSSVLKGSDKKSKEKAIATYRWDENLVPAGPMNLLEYANDPEKNANHPFLKCFWQHPPESYSGIARLLDKKNNRKNAGNVLQDELDPATLGNDSISTAQYESRFQLASALEDKVGRVDVEPAATQWKTPQTGRKSRARTSASRTPKTGSGPKRSRMSDSVTPSPVSQQQSPSDAVTPTGTSRKSADEEFEVDGTVYLTREAAKKAIQARLKEDFEMSERSLENGAEKVLRGHSTLEQLLNKLAGRN